MIPLHGGFFNHSVHSLYRPAARLIIMPGMSRFGKTMLNAMFPAHTVKNILTGMRLM